MMITSSRNEITLLALSLVVAILVDDMLLKKMGSLASLRQY
jgi:hypothetical protein